MSLLCMCNQTDELTMPYPNMTFLSDICIYNYTTIFLVVLQFFLSTILDLYSSRVTQTYTLHSFLDGTILLVTWPLWLLSTGFLSWHCISHFSIILSPHHYLKKQCPLFSVPYSSVDVLILSIPVENSLRASLAFKTAQVKSQYNLLTLLFTVLD